MLDLKVSLTGCLIVSGHRVASHFVRRLQTRRTFHRRR